MGMIVLMTLVWLLKAGTYWVIFRHRTIRATVMDCLVIAGAPLLVGLIPIPLPSFVFILASIGLASYLTMHYTGVSFVPDGLLIPVVVEFVFRAIMWGIEQIGLLG